MQIDKIKEVCLEAVESAGEIILKNRNKIGEIKYKDEVKSVVTDIDILAEKKIISIIENNFPKHYITSEEQGEISKNKEKENHWIIDPLDGTANYSQMIPFYCVSIVFVHKGKNLLGAIYDPINNDLFFAQKGKGAFLNNKKIKPSQIKKTADAICGYGFINPQETLQTFLKTNEITRKARILGSTSLALCYVACGRLDAYLINSINNWDIGAGKIILEEAGGKITLLSGENIDIEKTKLDIVATNSLIHEEIINNLKL